MDNIKIKIEKNICYTPLVYNRINKKLNSNLSEKEIEKLITQTIKLTKPDNIKKIGKNYYINNLETNIQITINSNTYRVITINKIK